MRISFPHVLAIDELRAASPVRQIAQRAEHTDGTLIPFTSGRTKGFLFRAHADGEETLLIPRKTEVSDRYRRIIKVRIPNASDTIDLRQAIWLRHPLQMAKGYDHRKAIRDVLDSWNGAFAYVQEDPSQDIPGLRGPQIGALHAVHAHWAVTDATATIVMPTGTGKTDTMLSILVSAECQRLLVVVPTDALRSQIVDKFLTLGALKDPGCTALRASALHPIVAMLRRIPREVRDVDELFTHAQVVVTTSSIAGQCTARVRERMAELCPYLFIDEAHHTEAPTWSMFKAAFKSRRILQFTATPFREDGRPLDGKIIFN